MVVPPYAMDGTIVTTFLAALNAGSGFAGHSDWCIPNVKELQSIVDYEAYDPTVATKFDTGCAPGCTVETCSCTVGFTCRQRRTANPVSGTTIGPMYGWAVDFIDEGMNLSLKSSSARARAVRGDP